MRTPAQKPARRGEGTIMRLRMDELGALVAAMGDRSDDMSRFLLKRFETAKAEAIAEAAAWDEHQRLEDALGAGRLAFRGWMPASPEDRLAELYVRHGDFVPDGDADGSKGWRHGVSGAFEGSRHVLRDAWQYCVVSRRRRTWTMGDGQRPCGREEAIAAGEALLGETRMLLRKGAHGIPEPAVVWADSGRDLDVHHYRIGDQEGSLAHRGRQERIGSLYGHRVNLIRGTGVVKVSTGAFTTLQNDQWHPCFDLLVVDEAKRHDHAVRTGPFWCETGEAWSVAIEGYADNRVLNTGRRDMSRRREQAVFPAFATREEALAYAATIRHVELKTQAAAVEATPLRTPNEVAAAADPFAQAA